MPDISHLVQDNVDNSRHWLSVYYVLGSLLKMFPASPRLILQPCEIRTIIRPI